MIFYATVIIERRFYSAILIHATCKFDLDLEMEVNESYSSHIEGYELLILSLPVEMNNDGK
jgi:hypothetical protein